MSETHSHATGYSDDKHADLLVILCQIRDELHKLRKEITYHHIDQQHIQEHQPLDLDKIEARVKSSPLWIDALQADGLELGGEVRHETRDRGASITDAKRVARWLRDHRADHDALIAEVKRLREGTK